MLFFGSHCQRILQFEFLFYFFFKMAYFNHFKLLQRSHFVSFSAILITCTVLLMMTAISPCSSSSSLLNSSKLLEKMHKPLYKDIIFMSKTFVKCNSSKLESTYAFLVDYICTPLLSPLYSLQPYLEELANSSNSSNRSSSTLPVELPVTQDPLVDYEDQFVDLSTILNLDVSNDEAIDPKTTCCRDLALDNCRAAIGSMLCSVNVDEQLFLVLDSEVDFPPDFAYGKMTPIWEDSTDYQCRAYVSLEQCTHPLSLAIMLGLVGLLVLSIVFCCVSWCLKCSNKKSSRRFRGQHC